MQALLLLCLQLQAELCRSTPVSVRPDRNHLSPSWDEEFEAEILNYWSYVPWCREFWSSSGLNQQLCSPSSPQSSDRRVWFLLSVALIISLLFT